MGQDPEGRRLPIKIDTATNGEIAPQPLSRLARLGNRLAHEAADLAAKRLDVSRRAFLISSAGAASTLMSIQAAYAQAGQARGGGYDLPKEAGLEKAAADSVLRDDSGFIFDIQNHHVNPLSQWRNKDSHWLKTLRGDGRRNHPDYTGDTLDVMTRDTYIKEVFLDSDTDMAVLTYLPSREEDMPLPTEDAVVTQQIVEAMRGSKRLLVHGRVIPIVPGDIERMEHLAKNLKVSGWKTYTQFDDGFWLDGEAAQRMYAEARRVNVKLFAVHKGMPFAFVPQAAAFSSCRDVGPAARQNPDITFFIYHSGWVQTAPEGPFVPSKNPVGVNSLIQSLIENDIGARGNVYAEMGSVWKEMMKRSPDEQAHYVGKLLKYVGEDRIVWGTDCILHGSPQDQIQAFRAFQISDEFCAKYGYPKLTPAIKAKIFGLNAAKPYGLDVSGYLKSADAIQARRLAYRDDPDPSFLTYGPRTRSEFARFTTLVGPH